MSGAQAPRVPGTSFWAQSGRVGMTAPTRVQSTRSGEVRQWIRPGFSLAWLVQNRW